MNRASYQTGGFRFGHEFPMSKWVLRLLIANIAISVLIWLLNSVGVPTVVFVEEWLAFGVPGFLMRPWTAITYMFLHGGFGHLFTNMLVLFFFGPPLENHWGSRFFIKYYVITGLGAALFAVLLYPLIGPSLVIGASGAIFGLLLAFAINWPDRKIYLYFLFPVPAKWFVGVLGLFALFQTIGSSGGGVAHWAHLGGLVTGVLYLRYGKRIGRVFEKTFFKEKTRHVRVERSAPAKPAPKPEVRRRRRGVDGDSLDEVDRILDKIRETGMDSLTAKERAFLDDMSKQYKKEETVH